MNTDNVAYRIARNDPDGLAAAVWITTVAYCAALAAAGMAVTTAVALHSDFNVWLMTFGVMFVGFAAAFGGVVGAVVGVPLGLLVAFGHRRLGVRGVAIMIATVAVVMSEAVVFGWFRVRSPAALLLVAFFALLGALLIDRRYQRAAREQPVH